MGNPFFEGYWIEELLGEVKKREERNFNKSHLFLKERIFSFFSQNYSRLSRNLQVLAKDKLKIVLEKFKRMRPSDFLQMLIDFSGECDEKLFDQWYRADNPLISDNDWCDFLNDFYKKWDEKAQSLEFMEENILAPLPDKALTLYSYLLCIYYFVFGDASAVEKFFAEAETHLKKIEEISKEKESLSSYKTWVARDKWRVHEVAALFHGIEPNLLSFDSFHNEYTHSLSDITHIIRATIKDIETWMIVEKRCPPSHPFEWINAAFKRKYNVDENLLAVVEERYLNDLSPEKDLLYPYLENRWNNIPNEHPNPKIYRDLHWNQLPNTLKIAIEAFYEYWHEIPQGMNSPKDSHVISDLSKSKKISQRMAQDIARIIKPANRKNGRGRDSADATFKIRSERKK